MGKALRAQGNLDGALEACLSAHELLEGLARQDATNARWQRDMSVSHQGVATVLLAQGETKRALAGYRQAQALAARLAEADPMNPEWQLQLAVSYQNLAHAYARIGETRPGLWGFVPRKLAQYRQLRNLILCREALRKVRHQGVNLDPQKAQLLAQLEHLPG
jgi:tetratricopeptide (TPR) repeat protein